MKSTGLVSLMIALTCFACRGGDDDDDDVSDDGATDVGDDTDDDGGGEDTTVFDLQSDDMPVGTAVTLRDVVVVAVDAYGGRAGGIYVQEPEGGAFSGVFVFVSGSEAAGLVAGDVVDIEGGVKDEFALDSDDTDRTLTEVSAPDGGAIAVTKTGTGDIPEPATLDPWDLAADDAESEKWEGVLVRFENVRVNSAPRGVSSTDTTLQEMVVTGPYAVQSALVGLDGIVAGDCYSSIVGIGDYFFNYKILPRSADDLVVGADGDCLPPEEGAELCGDETDNDYNGQTDCQDAACVDSVVACQPEEVTIADIQGGDVGDGAAVSLVGVTVTAVEREDDGTQNFWVADDAVAAESNGVIVFWPAAAGELPADVVVGATLDIQATVQEFGCIDDACAANPLTELTFATLSNFGEGDVPTPLTVADVTTLATEADSAPFEGVLVTVENVSVVSLVDADNQFTIGEAGAELFIDDIMFSYGKVTAGQCFTSITGVMNRDIFDGDLTLVPRDAADIDDTACP